MYPLALKWIIAIVSIMIVAVLTFLEPIKNTISFHPDKNIISPTKYLELNIGDINCWYSEVKNSKKIILFCHGNGGNMSDRLKYIYNFTPFNI